MARARAKIVIGITEVNGWMDGWMDVSKDGLGPGPGGRPPERRSLYLLNERQEFN